MDTELMKTNKVCSLCKCSILDDEPYLLIYHVATKNLNEEFFLHEYNHLHCYFDAKKQEVMHISRETIEKMIKEDYLYRIETGELGDYDIWREHNIKKESI